MPIYEFECRKCGKKFEYLMLSARDKTPECPACHSLEVQKVMSACGRVASKSSGGFGGGLSAPSCSPGG
jgi:putative FmdB family regulatory protein